MLERDNKERYFGSNRASKVIYGAILLFVFLAGMAHKGDVEALPMALKTFVAALAIVFAEIYSEFIGERIKNKGKLTMPERRGIASDALAIASASIWPCLIFLVGATGLYSVSTAFLLAMSYCLGILFVFSYWAARMSNMSQFKAGLFATATLVIGSVVIVLKYVTNH